VNGFEEFPMWKCTKCGEEVQNDFDVCWSCGTTREGVENTEFNPETEGVLDEQAYRAQQEAVRDETFVTVATFGNAPEAHMARSRLESEGITAFVMDELAPTAWGLPNALDGVRLQVAEKDAVRARALLVDLPRLGPESSEEDADSPDEEEDDYDEDEDDDTEEGITR